MNSAACYLTARWRKRSLTSSAAEISASITIGPSRGVVIRDHSSARHGIAVWQVDDSPQRAGSWSSASFFFCVARP